jgi:hypothetical protein
MKRVRLQFENIQQVMGSDELAVILLTDENRRKALSFICDEPMTRQILLRLEHPHSCGNMLPEALLKMVPAKLEMMIYGVHNGQYQVVLADEQFETNALIRMSDAVLLSIISNVPIYIESELFNRQSIDFDQHASGVAIPINTMDVTRLNMALQRAVEEENYELASQLRDEINRRSEK